MTDREFEDANIRLIRGDTATRMADMAPERSHWQKRQDEDLDQIEEALRTARDLVVDAHEGMRSRGLDPQHKQMPSHLEQELDRLKTFRYAKR